MIGIVAAAASLAAPAAATAESLPAALMRAAQYCEAAAASPKRTIPTNTEVYLSDTTGLSDVRSLAEVPAIVSRFIATAPTRHAAPVSHAVQFVSIKGSVWAVAWDYSACDVMVTGADAVPEAADALAKMLTAEGWTQRAAREATASFPLAQQILLKSSPRPDEPNFGTRLKMQWTTGAAVDPDGVQLEMNYLSGEIGSPTTAKKP